MRNTVLGDGDQTEALGRQRIADDLDRLDARAIRFARSFRQLVDLWWRLIVRGRKV